MPGISRLNTDTAGGLITGQLQSTVFVQGNPAAVIGDSVQPHAPCPTVLVHCSATMADGSSTVSISGIPVCRLGDAATCGHTATGSTTVYAG